MAYGIRKGDPRGFNKGRSSKFREGSRVRQTPKEGRRICRPKRCGNNNKDDYNSPKTLSDKNILIVICIFELWALQRFCGLNVILALKSIIIIIIIIIKSYW